MTDVASRPYGFYSTVIVPEMTVTEEELVWFDPDPVFTPSPTQGKRGPKPTPHKTIGMYFDYCSGLSLSEVAQKWDYKRAETIRRRFKSIGLPLRTKCRCKKRAWVPNPQGNRGLSFDEANRERSRRASDIVVLRAKAALPYAPTEHARALLQLRIDYPTATLAQLAALHYPQTTKDVVASVLRRSKDWVR